MPGIPIGAYTATEAVQKDIVEQLRLDRPEILVGDFYRPNLIYRVRRRTNALPQIREVLDRHAGESGIIYCLRRSDVDALTRTLTGQGYRVASDHAGMEELLRVSGIGLKKLEQYGERILEVLRRHSAKRQP